MNNNQISPIDGQVIGIGYIGAGDESTSLEAGLSSALRGSRDEDRGPLGGAHVASTEKCKKKQRFVYSSIIITLHMPIRKSMLQTLVMHDGIGNETDAWSYAQMGPFFRESDLGFAVWELGGPGSGVDDDRSTLGLAPHPDSRFYFPAPGAKR